MDKVFVLCLSYYEIKINAQNDRESYPADLMFYVHIYWIPCYVSSYNYYFKNDSSIAQNMNFNIKWQKRTAEMVSLF